MKRRLIAAGNWKMNTLPAEGKQLTMEIQQALSPATEAEVILFPPFTHISELTALLSGTAVKTGAQNLAAYASGAYTGEVSAAMLKSLGCSHVIIGHSERRAIFGETHEQLAAKVDLALENGLVPVFCIGETLEERENGREHQVVKEQLEKGIFHLSPEKFSGIILAYEPVWAIGTGKTASPEQAQNMHAFIRGLLREKYLETIAATTRILYGGSVKASNAAELFGCPDIDGGLVGGASLQATEFLGIIEAASGAYGKK